jgi:hypothetical protein
MLTTCYSPQLEAGWNGVTIQRQREQDTTIVYNSIALTETARLEMRVKPPVLRRLAGGCDCELPDGRELVAIST